MFTYFTQDRVPADGIVKSGRSAIDESSFTGEPLPVTKEAGVTFFYTTSIILLMVLIYVDVTHVFVVKKISWARVKSQQDLLT